LHWPNFSGQGDINNIFLFRSLSSGNRVNIIEAAATNTYIHPVFLKLYPLSRNAVFASVIITEYFGRINIFLRISNIIANLRGERDLARVVRAPDRQPMPKVAAVLGLIPASSDTVKPEGQQMKQF